VANNVHSLSEYGCITNGRDFGEVGALMNSEMTGVYSGGLMYEYSMEANKFGIVQISGGSVQELDGFAKYASALSANPAPTGDGGFTSTTKAAACPTKGPNWLVDSTLLPAIPDGAKQVRRAPSSQRTHHSSTC
jgi:1,3-beta-glucanosyltransferase GAS5